jgi:hypothetical protein
MFDIFAAAQGVWCGYNHVTKALHSLILQVADMPCKAYTSSLILSFCKIYFVSLQERAASGVATM